MNTGFGKQTVRCLRGLLCLGLLASCGAAEKNTCVLLNCDFEQLDGWIPGRPESLTTDRARSGHYSYCMKPGEEFGSSYHILLADCPQIPTRLQLEGWTYLPGTPLGATVLVLEVRCHGRRPDVFAGLRIDQVVRRYEQWEHFTKTIRLPADLLPTDEVKLYVWCPERGNAAKYFDDLTLTGGR